MTLSIILAGGPSGSGKSTLGDQLSRYYQCPFLEGDDFHLQHNRDKMAHGHPLTDDDRWDWLERLSKASVEAAAKSNNKVVIVSCSMLKKIYRDYILEKANEISCEDLCVRFVFLHCTFEEIFKRVTKRKDHYMKSDMVASQFDIMEVPSGDELVENGGAAIPINCSHELPDVVLKDVLAHLPSHSYFSLNRLS